MSVRLLRVFAGAAGLSATVLAACSLEPKYEPPKLPEVASFKEAGDWQPAQPADTQSRGAWWEAFGDPKLNELESQLPANPDLRAAVARFEEARAYAQRQRSDLYPTVNGQVSGSRYHSSSNSPLSHAFESLGEKSSTPVDDFLAGLNLSWEIDLFGRVRNAAKAAGLQAQASAADMAAVELSLRAELAADYFNLRGDDSQIQLFEDTIKTYDHAYELTNNRYQEGTAAATDVDQAQTIRQNARAQLAGVRLQRANLEHSIAVLLGQMPSSFRIDPGQLSGNPPPLSPGLPSTLLERRPDVGRAERAMAAANAQIGVAKAAWFPVFSLTATAGFESLLSRNWFDAPSRFWSVGPQMSVPLLDGGARSAVNAQARASFDEAANTYRKTALVAFQEVEDNLAALHHLADQLQANQAASTAAQGAAHHSDERYEAGVADYVEVTTTHTAALQAQRDTISTRIEQFDAAIALVRASGGGWTRDQLEHPVTP